MNRTVASHTALGAIALLFFLQLFTLYVESIYRIALIKTSMGAEVAGVLFMLAPWVVVAFGHRGERVLLAGATAGFVAARGVAPYLSVSAQILCAGFGVGCFLILLSHALGHAKIAHNVDWAGATAIAVMLSILLRTTLWATLDWSMEPGWFPVAIALLAAIPLSAWIHVRGDTHPPPPDSPEAFDSISFPMIVLGALVLFASLTLIYLVAMSPGVTSAWSGANYGFAVLLTTVAWAIGVYLPPIGRGTVLAWNAAFVATLIWGILANRVVFPTSPEAVVVAAGYGTGQKQVPIYLMLLLSPVLARNAGAILSRPVPNSPRIAAMAVFIGGAAMFAITLMLIFSNVWGYVDPISGFFRNKFHLPFVIAGIVLIASWSIIGNRIRDAAACGNWVRGAATATGALIVAWVGFTTVIAKAVPPPPSDGRNELRVLTYNMQQGSERDGNQRYLNQLEFVRNTDADLVLLQESDTGRPSGGNVDAPRLFAHTLKFHLYYGPSTVTGTFGTAILSRYPLENVRTIFTYGDVDEVGSAVAEIVVDGRRIAIVNNHPAGSDPVKHAHVDALLAAAEEYDHVIAGGDFNFRQDSPYYAKLAAALRDTWLSLHPDAVGDAATVLGGDVTDPERFNMQRRIDHVFISKDMHAVEAQYVLQPDSVTDHPAYWCTIRW